MLNTVQIMGRMSSDPELKRTLGGVCVLPFSLVCPRDVRQGGSGRREVDFVDCVAWRSLAEFVSKNVIKGQTIIVTGRLQTWAGENEEGLRRKGAEVLVKDIYFTGDKEGTKRGESPEDKA